MGVHDGEELTDDDRWKILQFVLHMADISNPGMLRNMPIMLEIALYFLDWCQSRAEKFGLY